MNLNEYSWFLNGKDIEIKEVKEALEDVLNSGLTSETLEHWQVRLVSDDNLKVIETKLGYDVSKFLKEGQHYEFIEFPNLFQGYSRFKPFPSIQYLDEDKPRKYLQPASRITKTFPYIYWQKEAENKTVIITEGEKKAMLLWQLGQNAICLCGVHTYKSKDDTELFPEIQERLKGIETVYMCFDMDILHKDNVKLAFDRIIELIYEIDLLLRLNLCYGN